MSFIKNRLNNFLVYLTAFVIGIKELREPDIWWQLLSGKWMLEHHEITRFDGFSFTHTGTPWVNVKWLYEIFIALLDKVLGPNGTILLQGIINILLVYFLLKTTKLIAKYLDVEFSFSLAVIGIWLFLIITESRLAGRPEMITFLMISVFFYVLLKNSKLEWRKIWILIPLQCLWANMHEGYAIGIVMVFVFLIANVFLYFRKKEEVGRLILIRSALLFTALLISILVNPYGIQLWKQPFEIYSQLAENKFTTELYNIIHAEYWTLAACLHFVLLIAVVVFVIQQFNAIKKSNFGEHANVIIATFILIFLTGYLSFTANRNIVIAQLIVVPFVPVLIMSFVKKRSLGKSNLYKIIHKRSALVVAIVGIIFYVSIVSNKFYNLTDSKNKFGFHVSMLHNPTGAADFLKKHSIKGPAFSDYFVSSYLLWDLYPDFKSYIDLRDLDIFSPEFFEEYVQLNLHPEKFKDLDEKYNFNCVVISTSQLLKLQLNLYWEKGFNMVYADPVATVFLKENEENKAINNNTQIQSLFTWPKKMKDPKWCMALNKLMNPSYNLNDEKEEMAPVYAALFYNQVQNYPMAINLLLPRMNMLRDNGYARSVIAKVYEDYAGVTEDQIVKQGRLDTAAYFRRGEM